MNTIYRKTLLSVAIATLISAPAWSAIDASASFNDDSKPKQSQSQPAQAKHAQTSARDHLVSDGAARARASQNELYAHTPDELSGMNVVGSDGEPVGKIDSIVMGRNRDEVHAVISSGGILGMGTRETLIPLAELTLLEDDKVQVQLTKEAIAQRPEFKAAEYGVMESDRRISDFSAFEPTQASDARTSQRQDTATPASRPAQSERGATVPDAARSATAADRARSAEAQDLGRRAASQSEMHTNPLHFKTPKDLNGMEVIGSDGKKIGNVKAIVSRQNSNDVHAVISSGGFLGIGSTEILVPLNELKSVGDKQLQAEFSQAAVDSQPKYATPEYENLDKDRPISEFFAHNQSPDGEAQQPRDRAKGQLR